MDQINITSVTSRLTVLDVARQRVQYAEESLTCAKDRYIYAIQLLEDAMKCDETVIECQELVDEYQDLYGEALRESQDIAILAWEDGFTGGKKEWMQDGWEIRLRTTKTPKVTDPDSFTGHLKRIGAEVNNIIKSVTLHKAATNKLNDGISGGLNGLEVEERTSCSFLLLLMRIIS